MPLLNDVQAQKNPKEVTRLVLCSGKVYYDLVGSQDFHAGQNIAVARLEEIYPFPADELRTLIAGYPNLQEIVWMQEEPCNMGAWMFVAPRLKDPEMVGWRGELTYAGRAEAASPAEGSMSRHLSEQARILRTALSDVPQLNASEPKLTGRKALKIG